MKWDVRALPVGLAGLVIAACRGGVDDRRIITHDEGAVCLGERVAVDGGLAPGVDLSSGAVLPITVRSVVLGDSCVKPQPTSCSVTRDGERLLVKSELSWVPASELSSKCRGAPTVVEARCTTDILGPGKYKVILGARTLDIELPSHLTKPCTSDGEAPLPLSLAPQPVVAAPAPDPSPVAPTTPAATTPAATAAATAIEPGVVPAAPATGVTAAEPPPVDKICVNPLTAGKSRALKVGAPVAITITHRNLCVGSSCTKAPGRCAAKRQGTHVIVTALLPSPTTKPTQPCSEECKEITVTCKTDALPAGTYTVEHGSLHETIKVPTHSAPACGP